MIRWATPEDAEALAEVQVRAWRHAYVDFVDPQLLFDTSVEDMTARWTRWLAGEDGGRPARVWDQGGTVAGWAVTGPSRDPDGDGRGELYAIHVDPAAQGAGVGTALLARAEEDLRDLGFGEATLWTYAQNGLAQTFYERNGWQADADAGPREDPWGPAVRYRKQLG
jgi:ribosomal protein S18 acetylase RimI-like enzyme